MSTQIDWSTLSDHLFAKTTDIEREMAKLSRHEVAANAACGAAAIVLNTLAKGIQKATKGAA